VGERRTVRGSAGAPLSWAGAIDTRGAATQLHGWDLPSALRLQGSRLYSPSEPEMLVTLDPERLRYEMAIRNLDGVSLARASGVTENTISHALQGHRVRKGTLRQIAAGLLTFPPLRMVEDLVAKPEGTILLTGTLQQRGPRAGVPGSPAGSA